MTKSANFAVLAAAALLAGSASFASVSAGETVSPAAAIQFTEKQAREHLESQGYKDISNLVRNENGGWTGTATKDGNKRMVAVGINVAR